MLLQDLQDLNMNNGYQTGSHDLNTGLIGYSDPLSIRFSNPQVESFHDEKASYGFSFPFFLSFVTLMAIYCSVFSKVNSYLKSKNLFPLFQMRTSLLY